MAERWTGFGDSDSDQEAAAARNRQWEELWGAEENDWGDEEEEEGEEYEEREDEDEEQEEREDEDEDAEWENVNGGNWTDFEEEEEEEEEEDWEEEEEKQVKLEERKEDWEDEDEDSHLSLEALRVLDKLKDMDCPFLKGLYKSRLKTAKQFLCTPSVYRLDILAWLFTRLHPSFQESFDTWQNSNAEEKIIELTKLGFELMLCGPNDQDIIKGCAQGKRQLCFMKELISLIEGVSSEVSGSFYSVDQNNCDGVKRKIKTMKYFNPSVPKENTDQKSKPLPAEAKPCCEKKESSPEKPLEAKKTKVEELSEKLTKLTEMLQAHKEEDRKAINALMGTSAKAKRGKVEVAAW